jgi:S1-C subfamily serine protease
MANFHKKFFCKLKTKSSLIYGICLSSGLIITLSILGINRAKNFTKAENSFPNTSNTYSSQTFSREQLCQRGKFITVKILSREKWGSGILIQKQGNTYNIVTNEHVLDKEKEEYTIETYDGKKHQARVLSRFTNPDQSKSNDLAILQFSSSEDYSIADRLTTALAGQKVIATGYPHEPDLSFSDNQGFMCSKMGYINLNLERPMQQGYQLGSSISNIRNGMSGGPLLNEQGFLVGINGRGQPVFMINPQLYIYKKDGTFVSESLSGLSEAEALEYLSKLAWGIPIKTLAELSPQLNLAFVENENEKNNNEKNNNIELENIAQQISVFVVKTSISPLGQKINTFNSGVIVAREDKTYYVLTNNKVVEEKKSYQIITPDQNSYKATVIKQSPEFNLAILEFSNNQNSEQYEVADLTKSENLLKNNIVFTIGWQEFENNVESTLLDFAIEDYNNSVQYFQLINKNQNITGILGAGILNQEGILIGIYGGLDPQLNVPHGIPINLFWQIAPPKVKKAL